MPTKEQRENLIKLAAKLDTLPDEYEHFNMRTFLSHNGTCDVHPDEMLQRGDASYIDNCGTVACAIGHGPAAGIPLLPSEVDEDEGINWALYTERAFGIYTFTNDFDFLFGGGWTRHDNTPRGASARIRYYLAGEKIPDLTYESEMDHVDTYARYRIAERAT